MPSHVHTCSFLQKELRTNVGTRDEGSSHHDGPGNTAMGNVWGRLVTSSCIRKWRKENSSSLLPLFFLLLFHLILQPMRQCYHILGWFYPSVHSLCKSLQIHNSCALMSHVILFKNYCFKPSKIPEFSLINSGGPTRTQKFKLEVKNPRIILRTTYQTFLSGRQPVLTHMGL